MARIAGVSYLGLAPITYGEGGSISYGALQEIKQFISFSATKNYSETQWYSNDTVEETFASIVSEDIEIVLGRMTGDVKALIAGANYSEKGVMTEKADDVQKEFGLVVVLTQLPEGKLCKAYTRVKLKVESTEGETQTDSITDSQVTLSGSAIPDANKVLCYTVDSNDSKADKTVVDGWTTAFYKPTV